MATHAMSPVDAAWYHMDGPANQAIVTSVAITKRPLDFARVRRDFRDRLLSFDRFRQRVVDGVALTAPAWEDVAEVDLDAHLVHMALPAPGGEDALRMLVGGLAGLPLDHRRPLWQAHVIDGVDGGSALVMRYHHCIGDGTAMMAVAARLFDMPHEAAQAPARPAPVPDASLIGSALRLAGEAGAVVSDLVKWPDPPSPFKGEFGMRKSVAWSAPVPIDEIKAIGAACGAKVNDVLVAALSGALRGYLRRRGIEPARTTLRAMVPVDLRPAARVGELGNEFGLVILDLPVAATTSAARLAKTKAAMDALKASAEAPAMRLLLDLFGRVPKAIEDIACDIFGSKASLVLTNVRGPRESIRLAGVPVERLMFCVPHPGGQLGMGASIMSYRGMATLTIVADAALVPDPQAITRAFDREMAAMRRRNNTPRSTPARRRTMAAGAAASRGGRAA
jgi:diacylglycerol O-acyltransferase / wax synthase